MGHYSEFVYLMSMKPVHKRLLLICVTVSFLVAVVLTVKLIWFKPFSIHHFFERAYYEMLLEDPESLSRSHLLDGVPFFDQSTKLSDLSSAHQKHQTELGKQLLKTLEEYDRDDLSGTELGSYDVLHWFLQHNVEGEQFQFYDYPLNQFSGAHLAFPSFMMRGHKINSAKDAENYLARLKQWPDKVSGLIEAMEYRRQIGIIPPTGVIRQVAGQCRDLVQQDMSDDLLYAGFSGRLRKKIGISENDSLALSNQCKALIFEEVHPAYRALIDYLELLEKSSTEVHGVWRWEQGKSFYRYSLQTHTTLDISPDELYHIGETEKERIEAKMRAILTELGYEDSLSIAQNMALLNADPQFKLDYDSTESDKNLSLYQDEVDQAYEAIRDLFYEVPEDPIEVNRMNPIREKGGSLALYGRNRSGDGGILHVNLGNLKDQATFSIPTTVHHEAIPGHHLQRSIRLKLTDLPTFRRFLPFSAYTEGWAMYCEVLGDEIGLIETPEEKLGMLQLDLLRTVRLLCDIGIHHKKWLRDQAIHFIIENTGLPTLTVEREIDRYIVNPGQGCAYKVGQLKMLELRNRMKSDLGDYYDIRQFHDVVLRNGAVPLDILDRMVNEEIDKLKAESLSVIPEPI
jgi:uncharacterized protein (DUF885 family)